MVSIVALYGHKSQVLTGLLKTVQSRLLLAAGSAFQPYTLEQIHATILGMPPLEKGSLINANFLKYRNESIIMRFEEILEYFRTCDSIPFWIQIGGFTRLNHPFFSREKTPFERSFSLQHGKAVMIGWPVTFPGNIIEKGHSKAPVLAKKYYPDTLNAIRCDVQEFGFLHQYLRDVDDHDNDFYFRIGLYDEAKMSTSSKAETESALRNFLSTIRPIRFQVKLSDLFVVSDNEETLPFKTTRYWSITDSRLTSDLLLNLYLGNDH